MKISKPVKKQLQAKKKPELKSPLKAVSLMDVSRDFGLDYFAKIKRIEILNLPAGLKATGQLNVVLDVNDRGVIRVREINHKWLNVKPEDQSDMIKQKIIRLIM